MSIFTIDLKRTGINIKYLDQGIQNQTSTHTLHVWGGGFSLFGGVFVVAGFLVF